MGKSISVSWVPCTLTVHEELEGILVADGPKRCLAQERKYIAFCSFVCLKKRMGSDLCSLYICWFIGKQA